MKFLILIMVLFSCGTDKATEYRDAPNDNPGDGGGNPGGGGQVTWNSVIEPLVTYHCANCHAGAPFVTSETGFLGSNSCRRIDNDSMPQRNSPRYGEWTDAIKDTIDGFCRAKL